jgi:hypothetical protein
MTDAELKAIELTERARQVELRRIVAAGGAVWDYILEKWIEAPR